MAASDDDTVPKRIEPERTNSHTAYAKNTTGFTPVAAEQAILGSVATSVFNYDNNSWLTTLTAICALARWPRTRTQS